MGTDIHFAIQFFRDGSWHTQSELSKRAPHERDYMLFNLLSGVRERTPDIVPFQDEPRGLPMPLEWFPGHWWPCRDHLWGHTYASALELLSWDGWYQVGYAPALGADGPTTITYDARRHHALIEYLAAIVWRENMDPRNIRLLWAFDS